MNIQLDIFPRNYWIITLLVGRKLNLYFIKFSFYPHEFYLRFYLGTEIFKIAEKSTSQFD